MSYTLVPLQYAEADEEVFLGYSMNKQRQISNETAQLIDAEIKRIVEDGYDRAKQVLTDNIGQLHSLANALLEFETLTGDEIKRVIAEIGRASCRERVCQSV